MTDSNLSDIKVLVINNDPEWQAFLRQTLGDLGVGAVKVMTDPTEAVTAAQEFRPNLILTEWDMKPIDGAYLVHRLRTAGDDFTPYVPIIVITSSTEPNEVKRARDAGVNAVLAKPLSIDILRQRITSVVAEARPFIKTQAFFGPDRRRRDKASYRGPDRRRRTDAREEGSGESAFASEPVAPTRQDQ